MTAIHFNDVAQRIQYLLQGRHRDNFPGFQTDPLVLLLDGYDLSSTAEKFIHSVPFEDRFNVAFQMKDEKSYWFLFFLLLGFSLHYLAMSQNMTFTEAQSHADSEIEILRNLSRRVEQ